MAIPIPCYHGMEGPDGVGLIQERKLCQEKITRPRLSAGSTK